MNTRILMYQLTHFYLPKKGKYLIAVLVVLLNSYCGTLQIYELPYFSGRDKKLKHYNQHNAHSELLSFSYLPQISKRKHQGCSSRTGLIFILPSTPLPVQGW